MLNISNNTTVSGLVDTLTDAVISVGKSAVHTLIPDDYEYYLCSLELFDSDYTKVGFLSFVIMPDQMSESRSPIQSITKTHGGIVTTFNSTFTPVDISLVGTFGRKWRILTDFRDPSEGQLSSFLNLNVGNVIGNNIGVKSGYGMTKVLEHILRMSNELDSKGRPYFLCFNNYAFNTSYVVDVMNYSFHQSVEQNMIWYYSISMRAVGTKPKTSESTNLLATVATSSIASGLTKVVTNMIGF